MKKLTISSLALLVLGFAPVAFAQTNISSGHWDIAAHEHLHEGETELELELHNHDLDAGAPLQGSTITYNFGTNAKVDVPTLGSLWVSPHSQSNAITMNMPFIGFSAEELTAPFAGPVTFTMTGFSYTGSGTGNFYMFEDAELFFDSRSTNAFGNYGSFSVDVGQHSHGEFGFSDAGLYEITLVASGDNGEPVSGDPATFTFDVVPEPSTYALLGLGAGALALLRWRKRSRQS
jgi:surface-anchored protein